MADQLDGAGRRARAVIVIEPGFKATWEVVEQVRKYYLSVLA